VDCWQHQAANSLYQTLLVASFRRIYSFSQTEEIVAMLMFKGPAAGHWAVAIALYTPQALLGGLAAGDPRGNDRIRQQQLL